MKVTVMKKRRLLLRSILSVIIVGLACIAVVYLWSLVPEKRFRGTGSGPDLEYLTRTDDYFDFEPDDYDFVVMYPDFIQAVKPAGPYAAAMEFLDLEELLVFVGMKNAAWAARIVMPDIGDDIDQDM